MQYFSNDQALETAMLKTCLLFDSSKIKEKRELGISKVLLSIIISGKASDKVMIKKIIREQFAGVEVDDSVIDSALRRLVDNKFIEKDSHRPTLETRDKIDEQQYSRKKQLSNLVREISELARSGYGRPFDSKEQVEANIKECINYYYAVGCLSIIDMDDRPQTGNLGKLADIASRNLPRDKATEISEHIINAVGQVIQNPTPQQKDILEAMARQYVTMRILGFDPKMNSFKATAIRDKVFILDTDVVLNLVATHAKRSDAYRKLVKILISIGCELYVPDEVLEEVWAHAEAANRLYYEDPRLVETDGINDNLDRHNVFLEDYVLRKKDASLSSHSWNTYIGNIYNSHFGKAYTVSQVKSRLDDKINFRNIPGSTEPNQQELEKLALECTGFKSTWDSHDSQRSENDKKKIALADSKFYLSIRQLNLSLEQKEGAPAGQGLLKNRYYILTDFRRVHICAKKLGMDYNVLCKPTAIIGYLSQIGAVPKEETQYINLFENIFLTSITDTSIDNLKALSKIGIDIRGKNVVALRYNLQEYITKIFENGGNIDDRTYQDINKKGYSFIAPLQAEIDKNYEQRKKIKELESERVRDSEVINAQKRTIEDLKARLGKQKYNQRVSSKTRKLSVRKKKRR